MERKLHEWYLAERELGKTVTAKQIKEKAIALTTCRDFIASKGWLDKFKIRYNLDISKEALKSED